MPELPAKGYYAQNADKTEEFFLLVQAQTSNTEIANQAKTQLVERNIGFIKDFVLPWAKENPSIDPDELINHSKLAFVKAVENYSLHRGASIRTYARFHLLELKREVFKFKKNRHIEYDDELHAPEYYIPNPDFKKFDLKAVLCEAIDAKLTHIEGHVIYDLYFGGKARKQIGNERNISAARISQIISNSLPKLKKYLDTKGITPGFLELN